LVSSPAIGLHAWRALRAPSITLPVWRVDIAPSRPASTHELGGGIWRNPRVGKSVRGAMRSYPRSPPCPRSPRCPPWLPVMSMMAVMTALSSATTLPLVLVPDGDPALLTLVVHCLGLFFALDVSAALLVT